MILNHEIPILILTPTKNNGIHGGLRIDGANLKDYVYAMDELRGALAFINEPRLLTRSEGKEIIVIQEIALASGCITTGIVDINDSLIIQIELEASSLYNISTPI